MIERRTEAAGSLIGRQDELQTLVLAVTAPPTLALVEGEEGIGKSRLVEEMFLFASVRDLRQLLGSCHADQAFPLEAVIHAVRGVDPPAAGFSPLTGVLRPLLPELADKLPEDPGSLADELAQRHRVFRALREMLACVPTVCVLENLHWADELTMQFLQFLAADFPPQLALVVTYRREAVDDHSPLISIVAQLARAPFSIRIPLSPLSLDEVAALIRNLTGRARMSEELAGVVYEWTAGIPFVVSEVIAELGARGLLEQADSRSAISDPSVPAVPANVRDAVMARVNRMSRDALRVAEAVAVLGIDEAEEPILAQVTGLSAARCAAALAEALAAGVVYEHGHCRYGFRHALARRAVYATITTPRRRELHLRAARALRQLKPLALAAIAHHYRIAARRTQWIRYAEAAADACTARGEDHAAVELLEGPLSVSDLPPATRLRLALKLGNAALDGDSPLGAAQMLRDVLADESLPAPTRGELRLSLSRLLYHGGQGARGREELILAAHELGRRPALAARAMVNLALPWQMAGDAIEHREWLDRALAMVTRDSDAATRTAVLLHRPAVLLYLGDPVAWETVHELPADGVAPDEIFQLVRGYAALARACWLLGHYHRAERFLDEADEVRRKRGTDVGSVWLHSTRTLIQWATGRWGGLEGRASRMLEAGGGASLVSSCPSSVLGWLALSRGKLDRAESLFVAQENEARDTYSVPVLLSAAAGRARVRLAKDDPEGAVEASRPGLEAMRHKRVWVWGSEVVPIAVTALLALMRLDEAERLTVEFAAALDGRDAPAATAALLESRGAVAAAEGDTELAAELLEQARGAWQQLPRPYDAARTGEQLGHLLLPESFEEGGAALVAAFDAFRSLGATWDAARVEAALRSSHVDLPRRWRGGRRSYGRRLSPREVEVARMARTGMTNREIAQTLFLSPRTVEDHVGSAIRKLGLSSRNQLKNVDPELMAAETATA